jgi:hypothetical protein
VDHTGDPLKHHALFLLCGVVFFLAACRPAVSPSNDAGIGEPPSPQTGAGFASDASGRGYYVQMFGRPRA